MNELRFGGANVVRDRGVEYSVVGYVTDLNKLLDHFRLVHNVGLADCCFDCFHRYGIIKLDSKIFDLHFEPYHHLTITIF